MKVDIEKIKLGHSSLTDRVFAGIPNKKGDRWLQKQDVTDTFIGAVISRWENQTEKIKSGKNEWEITVKKIKP